MNDRLQVYDAMARLFVYPDANYIDNAGACAKVLAAQAHTRGAAQALEAFAERIALLGRAELEELFTRTFDLNPVCCPEIGWHLFGERYDRGAFLVWMRGQLRAFRLTEQCELSDHLIHVLPVLARMDGADAKSFSTEAIQPALEKMMESLSGKDNPFEAVLLAVQRVLVADHGPTSTRLRDAQIAAFGNAESPLGAKE